MITDYWLHHWCNWLWRSMTLMTSLLRHWWHHCYGDVTDDITLMSLMMSLMTLLLRWCHLWHSILWILLLWCHNISVLLSVSSHNCVTENIVIDFPKNESVLHVGQFYWKMIQFRPWHHKMISPEFINRTPPQDGLHNFVTMPRRRRRRQASRPIRRRRRVHRASGGRRRRRVARRRRWSASLNM